MTMRCITGWALLLTALLAVRVPCQQPGDAAGAVSTVERLQQLLRELARTDGKVWAARLEELEQRAKQLETEALELRAQAAALEQKAAAAEAAAKALREDAVRLLELQKLLGGLRLGEPAKADTKAEPAVPAATPPAKAKSEPEARSAQPAPQPQQAQPEARPAAVPAPAQDVRVAAAAMPAGDAPAVADAELVTWQHIEPILGDHCAGCHDPDDKKGGLDVTSFAALRQGGGSGQTLVPGEPDQSRLWRMVTQQERPFMPRNADPLTADLLAKLKQWIEHGAAEDKAGARAFLQERAAAQKAAAAVAAAESDHDGDVAPVPQDLPEVALRLPRRPGPVTSLARSARAPLLAMPGEQQVLLLDGDLGAVGVLACELPEVECVAFSRDGGTLLAAGGEAGRRGQAVLFDVRTGAVRATIGKDRDAPLAAAVHPGAGLVALGGSSKQARVYRVADNSLAFAGRHDDFVLCLDFAPDGALLAAGDRAGAVQVWATGNGTLEQTLLGHRGAVHGLCFHRGGRMLATVGEDGTLRLWDVASGKERWQKPAHRGAALAVAFGPGDALASCGSDGTIQVFTTAGKAVATSKAVGEWLYAVAFGADDGVVLAGDWRGRVHRFEVASRQLSAAVPLAAER